jgi:hypothetical protein
MDPKKKRAAKLLAKEGYRPGSYNINSTSILDKVATKVGVSSSTIKCNWLHEEDFRQIIFDNLQEIEEVVVAALDRLVDANNPVAIIYKLKTLNPAKYDERVVQSFYKHEQEKELLELKVKLKELELKEEDQYLPNITISVGNKDLKEKIDKELE